MSVSTKTRGASYTADPNDVHLNQHNASRLSHMSTSSVGSGVTLGGVEYPVGSRVGKTGTFVIGDPGMYEPVNVKGNLNTSRSSTGTGARSNKGLMQATQIEEKGYSFEAWNWQAIRLACLVLLIAVMIGLLSAVIGVAVQHSRSCSSPFEWYKGSVFYTIDVPYFADSDEDKVGDLMGMLDKLDYLEFLEIGVVSLGRFLESVSPSWDSYKSFTTLDPRIGDINTLNTFISRAHSESDIKVVLELSMAWTSTEHDWFMQSKNYRQSDPQTIKYQDFYVWSAQEDNSVNGLWTKSIDRDMFYLSHNDSTRPLLNWNNAQLQEEFIAVLRHWLSRGVDGFVIRDLDRVHADSHNQVRAILERWKAVCDEYSDTDSNPPQHVILAVEQTYLDKVSTQNSAVVAGILNVVDMVIAPVVMGRNDTYTLQRALNVGRLYTEAVSGPVTCWEVGGLSALERDYVTAVHLYTLMLPGSPMLTAGQEIGKFYRELAFDPLSDHEPILWRSDNIYPYQPGALLNETTIKALKNLISDRNHEHALRLDSIYIEDEDETQKDWNFEIERINGDTLVLERKYKRKKAFYYTANFHTKNITNDLSTISGWGDMVADSSDRYHGEKNLQKIELSRGQAVVFSITN